MPRLVVALACVVAASLLLAPAAPAQIKAPANPFPPSSPSPSPSPAPAQPANPFPRSNGAPSPSPAPQPAPPQPSAKPQYWGAIAFTADGSYATSWKYKSKAEAEASVAKRCAGFGRGRCEVLSFPGELCVALVTYRSRRWKISFTGGGRTYPEAQQAAMDKCKADRRTRARRCQHRTALCGDGR